MQKSDFQRTGYLSRRSENGSWSNRWVSLSTDTGQIKFYIEKSGKKTMKSQINIKKGKYTPMSVEEVGKPFAFQIFIEDMVGKSDDANLILAAPDQAQFEQWRDDVNLCFTIGGEARRRKSSIITGPVDIVPAPQPAIPAVEVPSPPPAVEVSPPPAPALAVESKPPDVPVEPKRESKEPTSSHQGKKEPPIALSDHHDQKASPNGDDDVHPVIKREMSKNLPPLPNPKDVAAHPLFNRSNSLSKDVDKKKSAEAMEVIVTSDSEDSIGKRGDKKKRHEKEAPAVMEPENHPPPKPVEEDDTLLKDTISPIDPHIMESNPEETSNAPSPAPALDANAIAAAEILAAQLEKMGKRTSFKPPKKMGNLLNSKGMTKQMEDHIRKAKEPVPDEEQEPVGIADVVEEEEEKPKPPRQLMISVRPTAPVREGYLYKLTTTDLQEEDPWMSQFVSLEIATGCLKFFSDFQGKKMERGRINILEAIVDPIDLVYYGRLYAFKLILSPANSDQKIIHTFAGEDLESFSYWLISFDDCFVHQEDLRRKKEQEILEAKLLEEERMNMAAEQFARSRNNSVQVEGEDQPPHLEKKNSMRLDHLQQHIAHEKVPDVSDSRDRTLDATTHKAIAHKFHEDPGLARVPSFKGRESVYAADDINLPLSSAPAPILKTNSRSKSFSKDKEDPVVQLNENNLDDILSYKPETAKPENGQHEEPKDSQPEPVNVATDIISPTAQALRRSSSSLNNNTLAGLQPGNSMSFYRKKSGAESQDILEIKRLQFNLKKTYYPADRLSRRVKIWYCSGGFSLSTEDEIQQFVDALKNTDDRTLKAFSEEKFEHIHDWSNLLEVLRKYEQKVLSENPELDENVLNSKVRFVYEITLPSRPEVLLEYEISEGFMLEDLVAKLSTTFGFSELALLASLPPKLVGLDNPWTAGLVMVKEDLLFAEDLVLYQEEVIEHMWESYTALKGVIEQKDEVINQLYNQLSDLQDKVNSSQSVQQTLFSSSATPMSKSSFRQSNKELQIIADREFYAADKDGDGRISREEWRNWIQDKHNLIQEHNEVKTVLMNEIKNLRKALTPQSEQLFNELKRFDDVRKQQEEDLVKVHIENDRLKADFNLLTQRMKDAEEERMMVESDFQEQIQTLQKQLAESMLLNSQLMNNNPNANTNNNNDGASNETKDSAVNNNPYAYNIPLDRSTGITAKAKKPADNPLTAANLDLLALANMNDKALSQFNDENPYGNFNTNNNNNHNNNFPSNGNQWNLDPYQGEVAHLGLDNHNMSVPMNQSSFNNGYSNQPNYNQQTPSQLVNLYPQTLALRSPDEEDYGIYRNTPADSQSYRQMEPPTRSSAQSFLNNLPDNNNMNAPSRNMRPNSPPSRFTFNEVQPLQEPITLGGGNNPAGSRPVSTSTLPSSQSMIQNHPPASLPKRSVSPNALKSSLVVDIYEHPLRNALRAEVKSGGLQSFASAPSPYNAVRNKVSTTNYNNTINSRMKPTNSKVMLKTGTVVNSKAVDPQAVTPSSGRSGSPSRFPLGTRKLSNEDAIYEYSNRIPGNSRVPPEYTTNMTFGGNNRALSPSRFMGNTNSWKEKIKNAHQAPEQIIRAGNWKL